MPLSLLWHLCTVVLTSCLSREINSSAFRLVPEQMLFLWIISNLCFLTSLSHQLCLQLVDIMLLEPWILSSALLWCWLRLPPRLLFALSGEFAFSCFLLPLLDRIHTKLFAMDLLLRFSAVPPRGSPVADWCLTVCAYCGRWNKVSVLNRPFIH